MSRVPGVFLPGKQGRRSPRPLGGGAGLFLLSASTLAFEINLTRLFSVSQFYHFAFMAVSIALLGFGASGTFLALLNLQESWARRWIQPPVLALAASLSFLGAYLLVNRLPFDSFSIAWERTQVLILVLHYTALALPFFFGGMAVSLQLAAAPQSAGQTYAINLLGSASGALLALLAPAWLGGEGLVGLCSGLSAAAALAFAIESGGPRSPGAWALPLLALALLALALYDGGLRLSGGAGLPGLALRLSPYKGLSYALQQPQATLVFQRWNAISRLDRVRSPGIHSLPGLSMRYLQLPPPEDGLFVDGDDLSPVVVLTQMSQAPQTDLEFAPYLPAAIAFQLRPGGSVLILEPRGGLDVLVALELDAGQVTAVEANPLVVQAAGPVYQDARVEVISEAGRSFLRRPGPAFDVIQLSLTSSYHPVASGAYSLGEEYRYTVESFQDALNRLAPGGLLVANRWLQTPPSECLRLFALAVTALERLGLAPEPRLVAFRGYNTATLLVKRQPFSAAELQSIRRFAEQRAFDLIYAPGILPQETNRFNRLPESLYSQAFQTLLQTQPRQDFYEQYPYEVSPPNDNHPFFGHYFKWSQAPQVLAELGKTWQPFGGAGYFVLLALLTIAVLLAGLLILLPVVLARRRQRLGSFPAPAGLYFGLIGFAFLLVEIPLLQRFILFLGQPAYAMTAVLFSLLFFSGLGSLWVGGRNPASAQRMLGSLALLALALRLALPLLFDAALGFEFLSRLALAVAALAPLGFLMGVPFPAGIRWLLGQAGAERQAAQVPWVWAVNGAASVVAAVLAALLALSFGFDLVLLLGTLCYAGAWGVFRWQASRLPWEAADLTAG